MAIIAKIEQQKKNPERYNLYIEKDNDIIFMAGVDQDIIIQYSLGKGSTVDEKKLEEILFHDHIKKGWQKSLHYLSYRMRTTSEMETYLKDKEFEVKVIQSIISKLQSYNFLDDSSFAASYVKEQINNGKKGPTMIQNDLHKKGISTEFIEDALNVYTSKLQLENIKKFIHSKLKINKNKSTLQLKNSIAQNLHTKGFSTDSINQAISDIKFSATRSDTDALTYQGMKAHKRFYKYEGWEYERRMKQYLYGKGFQIDDIEHFLQSLQDS